ncbi:MAG: ArsA family ATPase [Planctomycetes bacterium]|nr:ArsA family ATPase [Planctomycetota bacterium]MBI3844846.1 ArsA family ATPase [Planctomycetota bacterium]
MGKTTCATATAIASAEASRRVLVVSVDPAHSLGDALALELSTSPRRVHTSRGALFAVEVAVDVVLERWLAQRRVLLETLALRGTYLDDEDIDRFLDLSLPGLGELLTFVEVRRLARLGRYDEIVVDTAPTGHAIRLLETPATLRSFAQVLADLQAKHRFLTESLGGAYRPDGADLLIDEVASEGEEIANTLRDRERSSLHWVTLPEALSVEETRDAIAALENDGLFVDEVIVNRMTPRPSEPCSLCDARVRVEADVIRDLRRIVSDRALRFLPALAREPRGVTALRSIGRALRSRQRGADLAGVRARARTGFRRAPPLEIRRFPVELPPTLRLLFFGGKGGVGKSTCAAAASLALVAERPDLRVLLLSTDPAHSLGDVLGQPVGDDEHAVVGAPPRLRVRELDARRGFDAARRRYRKAVDDLFDRMRRGSRFEVAFDRKVVEDLVELRPPGLDEVLATLEIVDTLAGWGDSTSERTPAHKPYDLVVVDMAPTGHALNLLEVPATAQKWVQAFLAILLKYREVVGLNDVAAEFVATSRGLRALRALLSDPARARFIVVTRAAELPRAETVRLFAALKRLHIPLGGVIVNALTPPGCARCVRAAKAESKEIRSLVRDLRTSGGRELSFVTTAAVAPPPRGAPALNRWLRTWRPLRSSSRRGPLTRHLVDG